MPGRKKETHSSNARSDSRHFDGEFRRRNCLGIEVMLDLHTNATEQCFVEARRRFDAQLFRESVPHLKELEQALRDHDAALSMGVDVALGTHTVTVFADDTLAPASRSQRVAVAALCGSRRLPLQRS